MIKERPKLREQITADWLPTIAWVRQGQGWTTNIAFAPKMVTLSSDQFKMEIKFFHKGNFLGSFHSKTISNSEILRVNAGEALAQIGASECDGIAEVIVSGEGEWSEKRRIKCIFDVWMETFSEDGKFRVVGPTGQFVGSNRVRVISNNAVETYPGVPVAGQFVTDALLMNPYTIPIFYQVTAFNSQGQRLDSIRRVVERQHYVYEPLEKLLPGLAQHAGADQIVSLMFTSKFKLISYCLFRESRSGVVTALDHTWPYLDFTREEA